ncbi:hypothetical protein FRD01_19130 [Microvenator marinus]|uniref:Uncharacterized protein n=1 Tax=Microvenator marinus TaxID=2600177 RepID=A0A5B8XVT6_9DELT|nr:hypothetical protein [Microvenator marinus]QED29307.1 hypothetical protein FRD01_19130 [Microvenator marinus]
MNSRLFLAIAAFITPSLAWACPGLLAVQPLDFLFFGVTVAVSYRLFVQWALDWSEDTNSAVYMSLLLASFGVGVFVTDEFRIWPGIFTLPAVFLAFVGAIYPKRLFFRIVLLLPVVVLSAIGSLVVLLAYEGSQDASLHSELSESHEF